MRRLPLLALALTLAAALTGPATAAPFGRHVAMCAHELGGRASAPAVTCTHDRMTMTFATFGAMVEHMRTMH